MSNGPAMTPDPLAPLLDRLDAEIHLAEHVDSDYKDNVEVSLLRDCRLALQQAAQERDDARKIMLARHTEKPIDSADYCEGCGGLYRFDTSVPSVVWNAVIRAQSLPGYLCLTCIAREFARRGESFTAELYGDDFHGLPIEVRVNQQEARDVVKVNDENNALRVERDALTAQIRVLRDKCRQRQRLFRDASREANHDGNKELDSYRDGKAVAFDEVAGDLDALLGATPAQTGDTHG